MRLRSASSTVMLCSLLCACSSGQLNGGQLKNGSVTSTALAPGAVGSGQIADGSVTATKLAPGAAVTHLNGLSGDVLVQGSANVSVTASGNTIALGLTGPIDATTLGGVAPSSYAQRMPQVLTVAPSGADYTSVTAALGAITDASATKPYVVRIGPGTYSEQVQLKPYVSLVGSGAAATTLAWTGGSTTIPSAATVIGASNASVADLTIMSDGTGNTYSVALYSAGSGVSVRSVAITGQNAVSINYGVWANAGTLTMRGASVQAGTAVDAESGASVRCDACEITGSTYAALANGSTIDIGASLMQGSQASSSGGAVHCPGSYTAAYALRTDC